MQKTIQIDISKRIKIELEKMPKWKLMMHLQEHGEISTYQLAKELGWTTGKTHAIVKILEDSKAVKTRIEVNNGRVVKFVKLKE